MASHPYPFLSRCVESGEFSDFTLVCTGREFKLHQLIVCPQSPVIKTALHGGFKESTSKVLHVNDFDVATVKRMIDFLYTGDYQLAPEPEKAVVAKDGDEMTEDASDKTAETILSHLRVNDIADYYHIQKLVEHSTSKICNILQGDLDFMILPKILEKMSTPNRDAKLRSAIAETTAKYIGELSSSKLLRNLDLEGNLTAEILEACGRRTQGLVESLSDSKVMKNALKESLRMEERRKDRLSAKFKTVIRLLASIEQCHRCNAKFECYIDEPTGPFADRYPYRLRCANYDFRH